MVVVAIPLQLVERAVDQLIVPQVAEAPVALPMRILAFHMLVVPEV